MEQHSKPYGAGSTAFASTGLQNGQTIGSVTLACAGGAATAGIGSYPITPSAATSGTFTPGNYSIIYSTAGSLTVNPAALTITADNKSRLYGTANPVFTGVIGGIQNGENITATCTPRRLRRRRSPPMPSDPRLSAPPWPTIMSPW